jgi:hypothetical protein
MGEKLTRRHGDTARGRMGEGEHGRMGGTADAGTRQVGRSFVKNLSMANAATVYKNPSEQELGGVFAVSKNGCI